MAFLCGASPQKPSGAYTKCKEVVIEVYDGASFTLSRQEFKDATLALCMSQHGAEVDRSNAATDTTLKFLGGLVTNNELNRASYAQALQDALPEGSVLKYLSPSMNENLSAWTVTDGDILQVCPAVWCVHMAAHEPVNCLKTVRAFLNKAFLNEGGWRPVPNTKVIQRLASPPGRDPWSEYMRVALKPRGKITQPCADELEKILRDFTFLTHDGSLAYTPPSPFKARSIIYKFSTAEEAVDALKLRDAKVWKATFPSFTTKTQEATAQQEGIDSDKSNQAVSTAAKEASDLQESVRRDDTKESKSTAAKEASDLQESVRRDDTKESKAFEDLLSAKAAEKLEELSEEHKRLQHETPTNQDRVAFYSKLVQSKKEIQSFKQIVDQISLLFKEEGHIKDKLTLMLNIFEQVWGQPLTDKERVNMTPLLQIIFNVTKGLSIEYDFNRTFGNVQMEYDVELIDSFKEKTVAEDASQNKFTPDAFFNLVNPQWEKQKKALQAQEIELVEKEDYESASAIAIDLFKLATNTPENVQKLLQEQGPSDVILDACDELVANIVQGNPKETMDLERAYKRMRHT